jgi:hypothetical protein
LAPKLAVFWITQRAFWSCRFQAGSYTSPRGSTCLRERDQSCTILGGVRGGMGVWTKDFMLAKRALYSLSYTSSPFWPGYFEDGVSRTGLEPQSSWSASWVARINRGEPPVPSQTCWSFEKYFVPKL